MIRISCLRLFIGFFTTPATRRLYGGDRQAIDRKDAAADGCRARLTASRGLRVRRKEAADLFMVYELLRGWRGVWIAPQRRKVQSALCVRQLLDEH